jgi:hypothetical protein
MKHDDEPTPSESDVASALEEAGVRTHLPTAAANIEALHGRLEELTRRRTDLSESARKFPDSSHSEWCAAQMYQLRIQAEDIRQRIANYETQQQGRN